MRRWNKQKPNQINNLLKHKPLRLLLLDDLGGMEPGLRGYEMRRWLRGLGQDEKRPLKLVVISNERLEFLFHKDDPARDSPFADLDPVPVELSPLAPAFCHQLVQQRLAETPYHIAEFEDLYGTPQQPRELLYQCARRYEALRRHRP